VLDPVERLRQTVLLGRSLLACPRLEVLNSAGTQLLEAGQALGQARALETADPNEKTASLTVLLNAKYTVPDGILAARAFWINLYNALTLQALALHTLKATVLEIPGFADRFAYRVDGLNFSLNDIEHGVLRGNRTLLGTPQFRTNDARSRFVLPLDPRVHFALNCGAESCPAVKAYQADQLEAQLELATHAYLFSVRLEQHRVRLPRLMQWYRRDFGDLIAFVRRYRPETPVDARIGFDDYDWRLPSRRR
jgi:hypothetical protein